MSSPLLKSKKVTFLATLAFRSGLSPVVRLKVLPCLQRPEPLKAQFIYQGLIKATFSNS